MSKLGYEIDEAIAVLPRKKDDEGTTCRSLIYHAIGGAAHLSINGAPWAVDVEAALHKLSLAVDNAIDVDPILKEIFDRPCLTDAVEVHLDDPSWQVTDRRG
jgi:hypothetical protein